MACFRASGLTNEQRNALRVLESVFPLEEENITDVPPLAQLCTRGSIHYIEGHLSTMNLPRGDDWLWNQSRPKHETQDTEMNIKVSFFKLNTRKSRSTRNIQNPPPIKIWIFLLDTGEKLCSVIWCERGYDNSREELSLEQLQFLSPFVTEEVAISLGWPVQEINPKKP